MLRDSQAGFSFDVDNDPIVHSSRMCATVRTAPEGKRWLDPRAWQFHGVIPVLANVRRGVLTFGDFQS